MSKKLSVSLILLLFFGVFPLVGADYLADEQRYGLRVSSVNCSGTEYDAVCAVDIYTLFFPTMCFRFNSSPTVFSCPLEGDYSVETVYKFYVNGSGAFFLPKEFGRWYYINDTRHYLFYEGNKTYFYRFEREKNCVIKLKRPSYLSARWIPNKVPVRGKVKGDVIIFSDGNTTYKIPLKTIEPYLWSPQEANYLEAVIWKSGALIYPAYKRDLIPVKDGGYLLWEDYGNERFFEKYYNNSEVERLIKPEYVFIYDGEDIQAVPIVAFRYNPNVTMWNGTFIWKLALKEKFSPKECSNRTNTLNSGNNKTEELCVKVNITKCEDQITNTTRTSTSQKEKGICGPSTIINLILLPLLLKRRK